MPHDEPESATCEAPAPPAPPPGGSGASTRGERWPPTRLLRVYARGTPRTPLHHDLSTETTCIGRATGNDIAIDDDAAAPQQARIEWRRGGWFVVRADAAGHLDKNDVRVTDESPINDGDRLRLGGTVLKVLIDLNLEARWFEEIYKATIQDGLTEVYNRRYLDEAVEREVLRARRYGSELGLVTVELEAFHAFVAARGELAGELLLGALARRLTSRVARDQLVARRGGRAFAIVVPDAAGIAPPLAAALRRELAEVELEVDGERVRPVINVGLQRVLDA